MGENLDFEVDEGNLGCHIWAYQFPSISKGNIQEF